MKVIFFLFLLLKTFCLSANHTAYITNAATPSDISLCNINPHTGRFENCHSANVSGLSTPLDIAFATLDETSFAYITNSNYPAVVTRCEIDTQNQLSDCAQTQVASYSGIAFHRSDNLYAYLSLGSSVQKCLVLSDGQLDPLRCQDSAAGKIFLNGAVYIKFQQINGVDYAYIANGDYHPNASVVQCAVKSNGDFVDCKNAAFDFYFNGTADVDFVSLQYQLYAYVTQPGGAVTKCTVNQQGLFTDCHNMNGEFYTPVGMVVTHLNDKPLAYIVDGGFRPPYANAVLQCAINLVGDLDCKDSGADNSFDNPFGIALR